jgi:glycosyltransferase involved in cell wall biosynthesis
LETGNHFIKLSSPLVSICLITYKHEAYIRQAIDGVLLQNVNFDWELIIADDCSPDRTRQILEEYKEKYPKLITLILQQKNIGGGKNFARLMEAANGKYIAYLEGDDYWTHPLKLQMQIDFLESNLEYGLVCTDAEFYNQQSSSYIKRRLYHNASCDITFNRLLQKNTIISFTVVLRTEIYRKIQFINDFAIDEGWKMGDYPLWLQLVQISKVRYIHFKSGVYRVLQNSVTNRMSKSKYADFEKSANDVRNFFINKYRNGDKALLTDARLLYEISLLKYAIIGKDMIGAIASVCKLFRIWIFSFVPNKKYA